MIILVQLPFALQTCEDLARRTHLCVGAPTDPPMGGWGCPACADDVNVRSFSRDRSPEQCSWYDKEDCHWECPSSKKND
eukprot:1656341-Pyramimonas_sp.AAC.1